MSDHGHDTHTPATNAGFDIREVDAKTISLLGLAIVLFVVVSMVAVAKYFDIVDEKLVYERQLVPVSSDLRGLHNWEDHLLTTYGIADKDTGAVRIPVDKAIDMIVAEAAEGKLKYPTQPQVVKPPADAAAPAPGTPAAAPVAANTTPAGGAPVAHTAGH